MKSPPPSPPPPTVSAPPLRKQAVLVEAGWEVCNPIGGIYQVLRSKAATMAAAWKSRYVLLGPWVQDRSPLEIELSKPTGWMDVTVAGLAEIGIRATTGRWLVAGRPRAILLHDDVPGDLLDAARRELAEAHGIHVGHDALVDGVFRFGVGLRAFVTLASEALAQARKHDHLLLHVHEWMAGMALPLLPRAPRRATVFTTHATSLGRYLAGSDAAVDPTALAHIDADAEASRLGITVQHTVERRCAETADVFTTVSKVTAQECAVMLGRRPDVVLPNGLNVSRFNIGHEFQTLHAIFKERIEEFVMGHFFPSYTFDLERTHYFFTSGRYEPRNKGFDLCLEALARLNAALQATGTDLTIVFFIITRRPTRSLHPGALHMRGVLQELREVCTRITADVGDKLFRLAATGERVSLDQLTEEYWALRLRRTQAALNVSAPPPSTTHVLESEHDDEVLHEIRRLGLVNRAEDRVKVVYAPDFITTTNPLWGIEYEQFVRGCHLGLFPSAYEPWGYTPQECLALGVPAITSDLAGFGQFAAETDPNPDTWTPWILPRSGVSFHDAAAQLAQRLLEFCALQRRDRIGIRGAVEARSWDFDWSRLGGAYQDAHALAVAKAAGRTSHADANS